MNSATGVSAKSSGKLTDEQRRIIKERRVSGYRTVSRWLKLLRPLARHDIATDRWRKWGFRLLKFAIPAMFLGILFSGMTGSPIPLFFFPLGIVSLIMGVIILIVTRRRDFAGHLQEFVLPLLTLLKDDISGPVLLDIDLRPATDAEKETGTDSPYRAGRYEVTEVHYVDPWFEGMARLVDGSMLRWRITDRVRKLNKQRVVRKSKRKTKFKMRSVLELHLKLPNDRYRLLTHDPLPHEEKLKIQRKKRWHVLRARRMNKHDDWMEWENPSRLALDGFTELLGALYQRAARLPETPVEPAATTEGAR